MILQSTMARFLALATIVNITFAAHADPEEQPADPILHQIQTIKDDFISGWDSYTRGKGIRRLAAIALEHPAYEQPVLSAIDALMIPTSNSTMPISDGYDELPKLGSPAAMRLMLKKQVENKGHSDRASAGLASVLEYAIRSNQDPIPYLDVGADFARPSRSDNWYKFGTSMARLATLQDDPKYYRAAATLLRYRPFSYSALQHYLNNLMLQNAYSVDIWVVQMANLIATFFNNVPKSEAKYVIPALMEQLIELDKELLARYLASPLDADPDQFSNVNETYSLTLRLGDIDVENSSGSTMALVPGANPFLESLIDQLRGRLDFPRFLSGSEPIGELSKKQIESLQRFARLLSNPDAVDQVCPSLRGAPIKRCLKKLSATFKAYSCQRTFAE